MDIQPIIFTIMLLPLSAAAIAGLGGNKLGHTGAHRVTCTAMGITFLLCCYLAKLYLFEHALVYNKNLYTWAASGNFTFNAGFLLDPLTVVMLLAVTLVSLLVHIYSIGYMHKDPGYQRFFSYICLFTFMMLMLVSANNFLQLFFGWEGVGLMSYLLIGFWFKKESANVGSLKAFIVNRVGDVGLLLGMALMLTYFNSLDYAQILTQAPALAAHKPSLITFMCLLLFVGAMGKSAQMPLHIWLPESMEGPTPISALIHAATMVTAGIYMITRLAPLYALSSTALSVVLVVGASTALFTGILGIVQNDIKRVIAYSTLSQLGYMIAALGASAFTAGIFHLLTHAAFKALLFLAAGSVIIALNHQQDMRYMGGLRKYLPFTYSMFLIGALALSAVPPFAGFYSKDAIIEAVKHSTLFGSGYAYALLLSGTFVTAVYIFRAFFLTFHTQARMPEQQLGQIKEPHWTMGLPLLLLAIPAAGLGIWLARPMLHAKIGLLGAALTAASAHQASLPLWHALMTLPFWFALSGIAVAWLGWVKYPHFPLWSAKKLALIYYILINKYGFDSANNWLFVRGIRRLADALYAIFDTRIIDQYLVNGSGRLTLQASRLLKRVQSGYLYHYALAMMVGLIALLIFQMWLR